MPLITDDKMNRIDPDRKARKARYEKEKLAAEAKAKKETPTRKAGAKVENKTPGGDRNNRKLSLRKEKAAPKPKPSKAKLAEIEREANAPAPDILNSLRKPETPAAPTLSPMNLEALRIDPNRSTAGVKRAVQHIPIRKPNKFEQVRVRKDPDFRLDAAIIKLSEENETYIVADHMVGALSKWVSYATLYVTITAQGAFIVWPINLPDEQGKDNAYNSTARWIAEIAEDKWVAAIAVKAIGAYDKIEAEDLDEPAWPPLTLQQIVDILYKQGSIINSFDHPLVKRLLGRK